MIFQEHVAQRNWTKKQQLNLKLFTKSYWDEPNKATKKKNHASVENYVEKSWFLKPSSLLMIKSTLHLQVARCPEVFLCPDILQFENVKYFLSSTCQSTKCPKWSEN